MMADLDLFTFFNEVGIINQLASTQLERALPDGLKLAHFAVLNHFARLGGERTPVDLARAFQVTKGAMTNTLQKLEARGLVTIRTNPDDGRSKLVVMTDEGRRVRDEAIAALAPMFKDLAMRLPLKDMARALPALAEVRQVLDDARN